MIDSTAGCVCGGARDQAGQGRRAKPLVVPKASPRTPIRRRYRAPRGRAGPWNRSSTLLRRGKGLLQLQEGPGVRSQPEPLDGRYQAPLQPEPPEGADRGRRRAAARVRVHALPEGRQDPEVRARAGDAAGLVPDDPSLDLTLFGATGFTGKLVAHYLAENAPGEARIGLAGRSEEKLAAVRSELPAQASDWPLVVADKGDEESLRKLAEGTRAVVTTVGPYAKGGLALVEEFFRAGTHHADPAGEVLFIRDSIDAYDAVARESGARIVHASGFDSIPSDLGVLVLAEKVKADGAGELEDTTFMVVAVRGGISGSTIDSLLGQLDEAKGDRDRGKISADPYALSPDRSAEPDLGDEGDLRTVKRDSEIGAWLAPFMMAPINTRVVRRSNALQGWGYGRKFRYREVMGFRNNPAAPAIATAVTAGLGGLMAGLSFGPTRSLLMKALPSAGEGPSEKMRDSGFYKIEIHARSSSGARYVCTVTGQGDPGYKATSGLIGESGLCLALDGGKLPDRAGVLTPATAMGMPLVERLRAAGYTFDAERAG